MWAVFCYLNAFLKVAKLIGSVSILNILDFREYKCLLRR